MENIRRTKYLILIIVSAAVFTLALALLPIKTTYSSAVCDKTDSQIGTCARIEHKESFLGTRDSYLVELTPTNKTSFESNDRRETLPLNASCGSGEPKLSWTSDLLVVSSKMNCTFERKLIGQW